MKRFILISFLFAFSYTVLSAQQNPVYRDLTLSQSEQTVRINFILVAGSTCFGIFIHRSADSSNFVQIGEIPGNCGSPTDPVSYAFTDENPIRNQKSYYKISFGGAAYSEIVSIEMLEPAHGNIQFRPQPLQNSGMVYFENLKLTERRIVIRNSMGLEVLRENTRQNHLQLNGELLIPGFYLVSVYDENLRLLSTGRLLVQH